MKRSALIIPISIVLHLSMINGLLYYLTPETYLSGFNAVYYNLAWLVITFWQGFYPTERKEKFNTKFFKFIQVLMLYGLSFFALYGFRNDAPYPLEYLALVYAYICLALFAYRLIFYSIRDKYRVEGGNYRRVVVVGRDKNLKKIRKVFDQQNLGYRYEGYFDDLPSPSDTYLGKRDEAFKYIIENEIDYIYCTVSRLSREELENFITFADNNLIKLKIIPDNKEIFTESMSIELYDTVPVLAMRKSPLDTDYAPLIKRTFDLVFSSLVIVFILSWLTPILYVLLKLESRGPVFFKQIRHGVNRKPFWCYKFRSMVVNKNSDSEMATKNDKRITPLGKFIRKTSIDELPQFFNVFMGSMSVVGPRPHMESHTEKYENSVDKYLVRHFAKPGITGLAQVKGYRGEILKNTDIVNRVRFDILYLEKWSLLLDLNIVFSTVVNAVKGEEKAY